MLKVCSAYLLLGLCATQALVADNDNYGHWAEGVYFPPVASVYAIQQDTTQPLNLRQSQNKTQNPWSTQGCGDMYIQTHMPPPLGFPSSQYSPHHASQGFKGGYSLGERQLYVPETYSLTISGEFEADNSRVKYRDNGHWDTERLSSDRYYADPDRDTNINYRNRYHSNDYNLTSNSRVIYPNLGRLSAYNSPYSHTTINPPYVSGLAGLGYNGDYGNTLFPQGLILPFLDAEMSLLPLW